MDIANIVKTVCGMSVVGNDWESLKRYNLAEIYGNPGASGKADTAAPPKAQADIDKVDAETNDATSMLCPKA